tara:strand:+ start:49 stop:354 length:306 start_codon:yes stop_codon:yes gene_type:complete
MIKRILNYAEYTILLGPFILPFISLDWLEAGDTICIYKNLTDHECFGCGTTRSIVAISQLEFSKAFAYNRLVVIILPLLFFVWIKRWYELVKKLTHNQEYT